MLNKKIAFVTDSTVYLTEELKNHPDVYVVPLTISFGQESFEDGLDLTTEELYHRINSFEEIPKTSQPSVGTFVELFEKLKHQGYDGALAIHITSKLSGTLSSCIQASKMAEFNVFAIDSLAMSYEITVLLNKALALNEKNLSLEELGNAILLEVPKGENYFIPGKLDQFYKGGRMSSAAYYLGSLLNIKPILHCNEVGEFAPLEKVRSEKKAFKRLLEFLSLAKEQATVDTIAIMHGNVIGKANELGSLILEKYPKTDIIYGEISSTIAAHAGEGTIAILWTNE